MEAAASCAGIFFKFIFTALATQNGGSTEHILKKERSMLKSQQLHARRRVGGPLPQAACLTQRQHDGPGGKESSAVFAGVLWPSVSLPVIAAVQRSRHPFTFSKPSLHLLVASTSKPWPHVCRHLRTMSRR